MADPVHYLLVDDLEENLLALEALLRRDGLVLLKARSGPEALELLLQYDMALALVDVQMPGMDGFELAELIRGMERTRRVPLIFLTAGSPDPQRRFRGYEAGAVDFIRKPIEPDILRSKADVFFELYRQRQEVARQRDELHAATDENVRLLNESREADRRKDEFLATLAHELRNPLAPIRSAIEIMRAQGLEDPNLEWAREVIDRQVSNMARLVDELLDVSRITTGKLVLRREPTELATVISRTVEATQPLIEEKLHRLEIDLPDPPIMLDADEIRLTQVFSNLLTNAAKYTDPGGDLRIRASIIGNEVMVDVEDSGVGIQKEMLTNVFRLFTQVDRSLNNAQGGLGVGLALVRRLVELHGGTVNAESAGLGRGSTFKVRLPVSRTPDSNSEVQFARSRNSAVSVEATHRILVVDDNVDGAICLAMLLKCMGHEAVTAHTGPEGLALARSFRPEIIFLDIGLPGMNGYELSRAIRDEAEIAFAKLVALTGWGTDEDKRRATEAGFDFHVTKPVDAATLAQILAKFANNT
ncbi:MAG TPA: response regulator [Pirellulales bacterium]|jgi:signal transduction histidine kinase